MSGYYQPVPDSEGLQPLRGDSEGSGGLQVVRRNTEVQKEAFNQEPVQKYEADYNSISPQPDYPSKFGTPYEPSSQPRAFPDTHQRRRWWTRKRFIALAALILIIVAVAIAVPLAVIKSKDNVASSSPASSSSSTRNTTSGGDTNTPSTSGAFNGTGIAAIIPLNSTYGEVVIFYQAFDGSLQQTTLSSGLWSQGSNNIVVPANHVRNGTPIAAWEYNIEGTEYWHVTYVDQNNILQDQIQANNSASWSSGKVSDGNHSVSTDPHTGLALNRFQYFNGGNATGTASTRIYYGGDDGIIRELTNADGSGTWNMSHVFPSNLDGNAGFSVTVNGGLGYIWYSDTKTNILGYYYQQNDISNPTEPYTHGDWINSGAQAPVVLSNVSDINDLTQTFAIFQNSVNDINTIVANEENVPFTGWGSTTRVGHAMAGTSISAVYPNNITGLGPLIYVQQTGNDLVQLQQNQDQSWAQSSVTLN